MTTPPAGLMLTMACALFGSSIWMTIATKIGAPVSTTHSIVGGIIGAGIAANGASGVAWGWSGFAKIIASWFVSPLVAGGFAAILFLITKYTVLERKNSLRNAMLVIPLYFALTAGVLIMVIVWKGAPNLKLDNLSQGQILGAFLAALALPPDSTFSSGTHTFTASWFWKTGPLRLTILSMVPFCLPAVRFLPSPRVLITRL